MKQQEGNSRRAFLAGVAGMSVALPIRAATHQVTLTWAHVFEPAEHYHQQALAAAEHIRDATNGRVAIEIIPSSRAGVEEEYPGKLKSGEIDMAYIAMTHAAKQYPGLATAGYPFIFRDVDHVRRYLESAFFETQLKRYNYASGNQMVSAVYYGARHITANKKIVAPEDLVGLKLREPNAPAYLLFGKAMEAEVIPIPFAKLYDSLKTGVVDAEENPLTAIKAKKLYEVQKFGALTGHIHDLISITFSGRAWQKIAPEDQPVVEAALKKSAFWTSVMTVSRELVVEQELSNFGMKFTVPNRGAFRDFAFKNISPSDLGITNDDFLQIQSLIKNVNS